MSYKLPLPHPALTNKNIILHIAFSSKEIYKIEPGVRNLFVSTKIQTIQYNRRYRYLPNYLYRNKNLKWGRYELFKIQL